jgi:hypothetical protein
MREKKWWCAAKSDLFSKRMINEYTQSFTGLDRYLLGQEKMDVGSQWQEEPSTRR